MTSCCARRFKVKCYDRIRIKVSRISQDTATRPASNNMNESSTTEIKTLMQQIGLNARASSKLLAIATTEQKKTAIGVAADEIEENSHFIADQNLLDIAAANERELSDAMIDRLKLDSARISSIANALREIAKLKDPVGSVISQWQRPNGLDIQRCLLYTSPSPRDRTRSRMPSSA